MTGITLNQVKKSYGNVDVIHGVDLQIEDGEFAVFVGPSGCGKSTLLRTIAGLEDVTSGEIHIGQRDVTHVEPAERGVAMVFQSYALYPHMTVEQNMSFGLRMSKAPAEDIQKRVDEASKILQLGPYLDRRPKALSGGQRQRVAIGRAIVRNPDVFLFDEPLSNLDAELRVQMRIEIARLHQEIGATMVYVTHDQVEAMTLADKIVVLHGGYIEQVGHPLHLYDDPDNQFVAGFIGSPKMNFIDGKVSAVNDSTVSVVLLENESSTISIPLKEQLPTVGEKVILGIRPEHFESAEAGGTQLTLKSDVTEHLGDVTYVYANAPNGERIIIERRAERTAQNGAEITVTIPVERAYLFDADGKRMR
ncbi:MAG: sn-glycerol-3-phosphate ABC transporter ATP-binding protein UgpC [Stappiaceae bacterium]